MATFTIEQHEIHLKRHKDALKKKIDHLRRLQAEIYKDEKNLAFFERQIEQAKKKKKKSFDADKFLKNERVAD